MLSDIVRNTQASARALARAATWHRVALEAAHKREEAFRKGDAAGEREALAEMNKAFRLRDQNMKRHDALRATLTD